MQIRTAVGRSRAQLTPPGIGGRHLLRCIILSGSVAGIVVREESQSGFGPCCRHGISIWVAGRYRPGASPGRRYSGRENTRRYRRGRRCYRCVGRISRGERRGGWFYHFRHLKLSWAAGRTLAFVGGSFAQVPYSGLLFENPSPHSPQILPQTSQLSCLIPAKLSKVGQPGFRFCDAHRAQFVSSQSNLLA